MKLYAFQETGIDFLSRSKRALLADEQGLGKTIQAIKAADKLGAKKILVICPASLKWNWCNEFRAWWGGRHLHIQVIDGSKAHINPEATVTIINYDLVFREPIYNQLSKMVFSVGIFDEAHYLKSRDAKRTLAVLQKNGIASRCVYKWALTGTPVLNRPSELYPLLRALAPDIIEPYTSFGSFAKRYCGGYWDGVMMHADGATNIEELNARLTKKDFMLRRLKSQVLKELPDKQYQIIPVNGSQKLPQEFMNWSQKDASKVDIGITDGAALAAFRHQLALEKLKYVESHVKELLEEKEKLVVFAYHRDVLDTLSKSLDKFSPAVIHGGVSSSDRQKSVDRFQKDPNTRLFLGQITAAGTGITLTAADTVLFAEISWVPGEIFQASDRVHRIGQKNNVSIQFLVIRDSLEEYMLRTVIDKKDIIERIVEDQREKEEFLAWV